MITLCHQVATSMHTWNTHCMFLLIWTKCHSFYFSWYEFFRYSALMWSSKEDHFYLLQNLVNFKCVTCQIFIICCLKNCVKLYEWKSNQTWIISGGRALVNVVSLTPSLLLLLQQTCTIDVIHSCQIKSLWYCQSSVFVSAMCLEGKLIVCVFCGVKK